MDHVSYLHKYSRPEVRWNKVLGTAPAGVSGNSEIKWVVTGDGRPAVVCTPGREALQVALLVLNRNRECWRDIADELSAYYNTPGRLAVFRRRFENAHRRPGSDSATFATELGILALCRISDMKEKARDLMV